jgi:hypothetical protein
MELFHLTKEPNLVLDKRVYNQKTCFKPKGLWLSVDSKEWVNNVTWDKWCQTHEFHTDNTKYKYRVSLNLGASILVISTFKKLLAFNDKYDLNNNIDWNSVAKHYDGIIIAPLIDEGRRKFFWYYSWDCSSGCIWNSDVIKSCRL